MATPAITEAVARAQELLAQPQRELDFGAEHVATAVAQLSELLPKQPTVPAFWLTLADAQMMQGKLSDGRYSLARCLSLLYPHGFAVQTEYGVQRRPRSVATTGAPDPFSVLSAPYSRTTFDRVLASYRTLAARAMLDRRLRFYIFNMLKAADDLAGAYEWLDCKDLDDAFLATYVRCVDPALGPASVRTLCLAAPRADAAPCVLRPALHPQSSNPPCLQPWRGWKVACEGQRPETATGCRDPTSAGDGDFC